jgi:small subunit ribosomal protein S8
VCEDLGLVTNVKKDDETRGLSFTLVTDDRQPKFSSIKRMSSPGRRLYVGWNEIPRASRNGVIIISTSQGMMTGHDARNRHLGGELVCEIS